MNGMKRIRARFHIHDSVLLRFPSQTSIINQVVLKSKAKEMIPPVQEKHLQESFQSLVDEQLGDTKCDSDIKGLFYRVYKQFLRDRDVKQYFGDSAIVHQIRIHLKGNLKTRKDGLDFVRKLKKEGIEYGILKSNFLRTLGLMDNHYSRLLTDISKRSNIPIADVKTSQILPSSDSFANEGIIMDYLDQFNHRSKINDYLVINSPQAAEALTSMGFKLGLKLILVTDPFFEKPTSTLTTMIEQYKEAKKTQNEVLCENIRDEMGSLNQITVKTLNEVHDFIDIINDTKVKEPINGNSFWGTLEQMELSILGNLESRHGPLTEKTH
ncbi:hypothetical protein BN7_2887 [Wickerhamomyces ciferrii]|uniref:Uncharacterized protein n=1 Tax=Wickerhamomyces ciferrii (strain ATCC 14091 / BCRC 22168 / CBS 111 / JCM 3599 / NBRC 0793 / NRRL Y-1031 F-60-10) TaxID=1206466 RepID=K0KPN2_WICCF|nr:uncharacterized protein BN7_2887 [Wickerhamomyces ciferrii]CCH43339.1 hypothetical protein BN7_2887 [Wickerhamomyces ciferrii]